MNAMSRFGWTPVLSLWQEPGTLLDTISTINFTHVEGGSFSVYYTPQCGRRFRGDIARRWKTQLLCGGPPAFVDFSDPSSVSADLGIATSQSSSTHAKIGCMIPHPPSSPIPPNPQDHMQSSPHVVYSLQADERKFREPIAKRVKPSRSGQSPPTKHKVVLKFIDGRPIPFQAWGSTKFGTILEVSLVASLLILAYLLAQNLPLLGHFRVYYDHFMVR